MKDEAAKERARRDKNFARLCKWFDEAGKMAEIIREESKVINGMEMEGYKPGSGEDCQGVRSAMAMLDFISEIAKHPVDYKDECIYQRDVYPELAFGLMFLASAVGEMRLNDNDADMMGWGI